MDQSLPKAISVLVKITFSDQINKSGELFHINHVTEMAKNNFTWTLLILQCSQAVSED